MSDEVEIGYSTYSSGRKYNVLLAITRNGTVIDPLSFKVRRNEVEEISIDGVTVTVTDSSSKNNRYVTVTIPSEIVLAVIKKSFSNFGLLSLELVSGEGKIITENEVREFNYENKIVSKEFRVYYYVCEARNMKIKLYEEYLATKDTRYLGKPRVVVEQIFHETRLSGDTFKFKDIIKKHGGKWSPVSSTWTVPRAALERLIKELEENGAEVIRKQTTV